MISVACSGFPVPTSTYFREFRAVEISDTELGIPGVGTRDRWLREAAPEFVFTVLAPKQIANAGFALDAETTRALDEVTAFAKQLKSRTVVFAADPSFLPTRAHRTRIAAFAEHVQGKLKSAVLDLPGWPLKETEAALKKASSSITIAFDPLTEQPSSVGDFAYVRLPGPSGYRSRYDPTTLDRVVEYGTSCSAKQLFVVLRNIDRFENGKYLQRHFNHADSIT